MVYLSPALLRYICLKPTRGTCVSIKPLNGRFGSNCPVASLSQAGLRWYIVSGRHVVYLFPIALSYICLRPTCGIFVSWTAIRSPSVLWHFCLQPTCGTFVTSHPAAADGALVRHPAAAGPQRVRPGPQRFGGPACMSQALSQDTWLTFEGAYAHTSQPRDTWLRMCSKICPKSVTNWFVCASVRVLCCMRAPLLG